MKLIVKGWDQLSRKEIEIFNSHFLQRFKCFQLNIDYDWSKFTDFRMDYEVTY